MATLHCLDPHLTDATEQKQRRGGRRDGGARDDAEVLRVDPAGVGGQPEPGGEQGARPADGGPQAALLLR